MPLLALLATTPPLRALPHQLSWRLDAPPRLARLVPLPAAPLPSPPHGWDTLRRISAPQAAQLGLHAPHGALLASRPWLDGHTLDALPCPHPSWMQLARAVCLQLALLHDAGAHHGDLQPGNVLIAPDGAVHLIDLPLIPINPAERGHVLGSAPFMAPELWRGDAPSQAADRYALAHLIAWLASGRTLHHADSLTGWANAHQRGTPALPDTIPAPVAGELRRLMDPDPAQRPALNALLDALRDAPPQGPQPRTTFNLPLHQPALDDARAALAELTSGLPILALTAPAGGGKTRALASLERVCQLDGVTTARLATPTPQQPWRALLDALTALALELDPALPPPPALWRGDRLHGFDAALRWVEALPRPARPPLLIWDDLHLAAPDVLAWLAYAQTRMTGRAPLIIAATSPHDTTPLTTLKLTRQLALPQPDAATWQRWRAQTLHAAPRDLAQGRWEALVQAHSGSIGAMLDAIDGVEPRAPAAHTDHTSPHDAAQRLLQQGAPAAAAARCEAAWTTLDADARDALVPVWTQAALQCNEPAVFDALEAALTRSTSHTARMARVQIAHQQGRHAEGLALLEDAPDDLSRARWRAQLTLSAGQLPLAQTLARDALAQASDALDPTQADFVEAAHLHVIALAAQAMAGEQAALDALAAQAPRLDHASIPATLRARLHAYRGIGLTRRDMHEAAADAYLRGLEQIEAAGLDAELPLYLLNVGTAYHKQGRLGLAREYYARGARIAQPTTRATTRALLWANQANIDAVLGRRDEAQAALDTALTIARQANLSAVEVMCRIIAGDLAAQAGQHALAITRYMACLDELGEAAGAQRRAELWLHIASARLTTQDAPAARAALDEARRLIEQEKLAILQDYHGILRARLMWAADAGAGQMAGIELFRRHLLAALAASNHVLVLQHGPILWRRLVEEGLEGAGEIEALVEQARRAIAAGLTRPLRDAFFAQLPAMHTPTRPAPQAEIAAPSPRHASVDVEPFYRLLSFNELILHTRSLAALWPQALEIALQLSGAERGFLLIWEPDSAGERAPRVAASIGADEGGAAVSLTIAEEAGRTGRTVVTLNAREDARFVASRSVVDLELMSVLCVPVRDASGLLGALYLDHRARRGMFAGEVVRMMEAYGHQLALAIHNVRRRDELEGERAALAQARDQLDALLAERELSIERMARQLEEAREALERRGEARGERLAGVVYVSEQMARLMAQVRRIGPSEIPAVIIGESGTGKELMARALHEASERSRGPFVAVNCAAIPETLFESELFGHVKGAFTGAVADKRGLFQAARGGTLFLDELGELPITMQVKLLRVLQERKVRRVGATTDEAVDARIVAATNRELGELVERGEFREDLYYRLAAFVLRLPPLRERREDIPLLATSLLARLKEETGGGQLTPQGAEVLTRWDWPGNIRELENVLRTAAVLSEDGKIGPREILPLLQARRGAQPAQPHTMRVSEVRSGKRGRKPKATREAVERALREAAGELEGAAQALGVTTRTLYRYIERFGL